jgi:Polyketide cyclase / dehydrase and lipid transport
VTALWIAVGVLAFLLFGGIAAGFLLLAMGRLHLDLGFGRSIHPLGPLVVRIDAPREVVFELISAPYLGRTPGDSGIEVLAKGTDLAVALHHTRVHFYDARTVEAIDFDPPARIGFRHLTGPVPHATEEFRLEETGGGTELNYGGEVAIDYFVLGRIAARHWVKPQWERVVREHIEGIKQRAEQRARRESGGSAGVR